jgi:hypothetical protein
LSLLHIEPQVLNHPARSLFTIPTTLSLFTTLHYKTYCTSIIAMFYQCHDAVTMKNLYS